MAGHVFGRRCSVNILLCRYIASGSHDLAVIAATTHCQTDGQSADR